VRSRASFFYRPSTKVQDATGLSRGVFTIAATQSKHKRSRCHGLVPWSLHDRSYLAGKPEASTAQGRGIQFVIFEFGVAASVILHGTSPWHLGGVNKKWNLSVYKMELLVATLHRRDWGTSC